MLRRRTSARRVDDARLARGRRRGARARCPTTRTPSGSAAARSARARPPSPRTTTRSTRGCRRTCGGRCCAKGERLVATRRARRSERGVLAAARGSCREDARGEAPLGYEEAALALAAARSADADARTNPPPLGAADTLDVGTDIVRGRPGAARRAHRAGSASTGGDHEQRPRRRPTCSSRGRSCRPSCRCCRRAAIVVETGGVLDHVAAQARERGIPAVVGAVGACRAPARRRSGPRRRRRRPGRPPRLSGRGRFRCASAAGVQQRGELAIAADRLALDEDDGDGPPVRALDQLRARPAIAGDVDGRERDPLRAEELFRAAAPPAGLRTEHRDGRARLPAGSA